MRHHRGIDASERTLVEQNDFAAAALFRRGAHEDNFSRQIYAALLQTDDR